MQEFHEAELYRDHPRLLNQAMRLLIYTRSRKGRALYVRPDVTAYAVYYTKIAREQQGSGLPRDRLMAVYQAAFQQLLHALPPTASPLDIVYDTFQYAQRLHPQLTNDVKQWGQEESDGANPYTTNPCNWLISLREPYAVILLGPLIG